MIRTCHRKKVTGFSCYLKERADNFYALSTSGVNVRYLTTILIKRMFVRLLVVSFSFFVVE